ncbi:unnamed protein product [Blepharisma stoltei]|uniref:Actin, cytoplasmic n=1 Tax=Blepharisma stoltei TaxID=1481888 RepID=A0AAU9JG98_9CILI|nr:unnamed protein product [Blepharisma stoltei]
MIDPDLQAIVIDNGSMWCRVGYAGDDTPQAVIPSMLGHIKFEKIYHKSWQKRFYVADEVLEKQNDLDIKYTVEHGIITNWNYIEKLWYHIFYNELRAPPDEHPVLLTETPFNPKDNRERMTQIMFETFSVPAFYVASQAALIIYSSGRTSGIAVNSGHGITYIAPAYEGYTLPHAIQRVEITGSDLTNHLTILMTERGYSLTNSAEREVVRNIKERLCYVAQDFQEEMSKTSSEFEKNYEMPDGSTVTLGNERFRTPEALFQPSLLGLDIDGIHEIVDKTIKKCDLDIRKELYENIVLSGGSTMYPGIVKRLEKEIRNKALSSFNVKIFASQERKCAVWEGGSILASLPSFQKMWITKVEYDEVGAQIVHRKCF